MSWQTTWAPISTTTFGKSSAGYPVNNHHQNHHHPRPRSAGPARRRQTVILAAAVAAALSVLVSVLCHLLLLDAPNPDPSQGGGAATELGVRKAQIMADEKRLAMLAGIVTAHGARLDALEKPRAAATAPATPPLAGGARALARVELRSSPPGAAVFRGRKRIASTPATISLELPADLVVTRSGYRPSRVHASQPGEIEVRLVPRRSRSKAAAELASKPAGVTAPDPAQARPAP